jgi:hypothetical protein
MSDLVKNCIKTWSKFNPDYEVVVLNRENLYRHLPREDMSESPWSGFDYTPQRFSDMVRLHILCQEGGFWVDATIIMQESLDWVQSIRANTGCECFAYNLDKSANDEWRDVSPVIESWFFACMPGCDFVRDWRDEFRTIVEYDTVEDYVDEARKTTDLQNIAYPEYLAIHVSAQKLLQKKGKKGRMNEYGIVLQKAEDEPYAYLDENNWNSDAATNALIRGNYRGKVMIKIRGIERPAFESQAEKTSDYFSRLLRGDD